MPQSLNISSLLGRLFPAAGPTGKKDPRAVWQAVLAGLVIANLIAAFFVFRPIGGSLDQLNMDLTRLSAQVQQQQASVAQLRSLVKKVQSARDEQDKFLDTYFLDSRTATSDIQSEIIDLSKTAGLKLREHSVSEEQIEGSDTLSMVTINGNYDGSYADLVQFVNLLDRSKRLLILENVAAAPVQQTPGLLSFRCKINTFVRGVAE